MNRGSRTEVDKYSAPSGLASSVGATAASYGIDIIPICKALELDPNSFADLTGRVSIDRMCRLLETCALLAHDEAFGLRVTDRFVPGSTGPYGYGLMVAPTALDFFRFMGAHQQFISDTSYFRFVIDRTCAELAYSFSPLIVKRDQYVDMGIALVLQRLRAFLGPQTDLVEVGLERNKPSDPSLYREKMSRKVVFGQRMNWLRLPAELFDIRNPSGDEKLFRLMDLQCRSLRPERSDTQSFRDELKDFILARVADNAIGLAEAAAYFRVSERTLQRRLAEAGTSINDLRDEVRRELASRLLSQTELSASEIAHRLGYSAPSAFSRSTVRWFGQTPRDYRKQTASAG